MSEFKGTKGKWIIFREDIIITEAEIEDDVICIKPNLMQSQKNWKANALLISKAPEMLEMLKYFVEAIENEEIVIKENFDNDGFENCGNRLYNEFKQLIKKATEI